MKPSHSGTHPESCLSCLTRAYEEVEADHTFVVEPLDHIAGNLADYRRRHNVAIARAEKRYASLYRE